MLGCLPEIHFEHLLNGEDVTLSNGSTVTSAMVMGNTRQTYGYMSVFLPDTGYISSFLENNADIIENLAGLTPKSDN